jgi:tetratricopeptide (TPR) repeat protein
MEKCLEYYSSLEDGASYLESLKQLEHDENKKISENLLNKGKEYFEKHNIDMALNLWNEAWQTFPLPELKTLIENVNNVLSTALEYYEKAQLLDNSNQLEEALEAVQECLKLNPDHRNAMLLQEVLKTKINMRNDLLLHNTPQRLQHDLIFEKSESNKNIVSLEEKKIETENNNENNNEDIEELQDNTQENDDIEELHDNNNKNIEKLHDNNNENIEKLSNNTQENDDVEDIEELHDNIHEKN